ncbi:MAG: trypsin-like peptidase domain-containing protein [Candidatus Promineifilaceae bacterium]|nr:trypsin-like peptidase domain-containing protein [Candidatus Promineifilaceae bacterium]
MTRLSRQPLIFLGVVLVLITIACQGLNTVATPVSPVDEDALVREIVATVEARLPEEETVSEVVEIPTVTSAQLGPIDLSLQETFINVYAQVNPSVVHIFVYDEIEDTSLPLGTGSGFVYDEEGYVVTNNHVVADGERFEVSFADGSHREATLVGTDVDSDLGVIKVEGLPENVQPINLGNSRNVQVGQFVIAIGNPFGEAGSMSIGVISGLGRTLESQRIAEGGGRYSLPEVIQTDAAINPGNSGGPLLNLQGEVIGVNSAISTRTGTNSGVGFSIPVNAVRQIVPKLISDGSYEYPFMGVRMLSLDLELQDQLDLPQLSGAYVTEVTLDSPAEESGLIGNNGPGGDLIVAVDDLPVSSSDDLIAYLVFETSVGDIIELTVLREGKEVVLPLTLGARP